MNRSPFAIAAVLGTILGLAIVGMVLLLGPTSPPPSTAPIPPTNPASIPSNEQTLQPK